MERDIDRHHSILHEIDPISGLSYRLLIGDLVSVEASGPYIEAPRLRGLLGTLSKERVEKIELACGPIASLWLDAKFEGNALQVMRPDSFDQALATQFEADLQDFAKAEERRLTAIAVWKPTYELDNVSSSLEWLRQHRTDVSAMTDEDRRSVAAWLPLFKAESANPALGEALIKQLTTIMSDLKAMEHHHQTSFFAMTSVLQSAELKSVLADTLLATEEPSFFVRLNPMRWLARWRVRERLASAGLGNSDSDMVRLKAALELEVGIRKQKALFDEVTQALRLPQDQAVHSVHTLGAAVVGLLAKLERSRKFVHILDVCPRRAEMEAAVKVETKAAYQDLLEHMAAAIARSETRGLSREKLVPLREQFEGSWVAACDMAIATGTDSQAIWQPILDSIRTLIPFHEFRSRAGRLDAFSLMVFAALRQHEMSLRLHSQVDQAVRLTIRRDASS